MTIRGWPAFAFALWTAGLTAQVLEPSSAPAPVPPAGSAEAPPSTPSTTGSKETQILGRDLPAFNPGNEIFTWDGKNWNISNNRLFQARFEKYLNAPEETAQSDREYQTIIHAILDKLAPNQVKPGAVDEAFRLLPKASNFEIDARLCDALADAVYSVWRAQDASQRLVKANEALEQERKVHEWNARMAGETNRLAPPKKKKGDKDAPAADPNEDLQTVATHQPYLTRLGEVMALIKTNQLKKELSSFQAKIEFQALIVQFFLQRRYQHVLMATRFYRSVFADGDTKLTVGKDAKDLFANSTGLPPTVGTLDSLANEAARDVREGVQAYEFLVSRNEMESATKRLGEAFVLGEYLPEIRTLPREKKRQALDFAQKSNQLISALEVKDFTLAERLVNNLQEVAKDFDTSKPMAMIETSKTVAAMHLAKAKNAAVSGDKQTLEGELKEAAQIWPRNPALAEVSGLIFSQADVQQKALVDLDQLLSQRNYRQIFEDKVRFIAATALYPSRQEALRKVLEDMQVVEGAVIRSNEIAKRGDFPGAWESVEKVFQQFPDDSKLNQVRSDLTTRAADFVRTLRNAEALEQKEQVGSSLAWYLKAKKIYPASEFAQDGVQRLIKRIFPEA